MSSNLSTDETMALIMTTADPPNQPLPMYWGFVAVALAAVLFGSNLIPVKKFETGDGMSIAHFVIFNTFQYLSRCFVLIWSLLCSGIESSIYLIWQIL